MSTVRAHTHAKPAAPAASAVARADARAAQSNALGVTSNGFAPNNRGSAAPDNGRDSVGAPNNGFAPNNRGSAAPNNRPDKVGAASLVRAAGRPASAVAFESAVVGYFLEAADILGVPKSVAAIYGICFASAEPLSFSDIDERLDISTGSISQGLRVLREIGALRVVGGSPASNGQSVTSNGSGFDHGDSAAPNNGDSAAPNNGGEAAPNNRAEGAPNNRAAAALSAVRAPRATRYAPDMELRKLALHYMEQRLQTQLASGHAKLRALASQVPDARVGERIATLENWHGKAEALLPIARAFLKG